MELAALKRRIHAEHVLNKLEIRPVIAQVVDDYKQKVDSTGSDQGGLAEPNQHIRRRSVSDNAPLVQLKHVSKCFESGRSVLEGVDLAVDRGEFVSLVGPSGSGKTTLLRLVAGLSKPTSGRLSVAGRDPVEMREHMSFIFQEPNLLPWRRLLGNVELPNRLRRMASVERRAIALRLLDRIGLGDAIEKYPWQLSGGMKMRASVARALSTSPELLLLDEPFASVDELTRDQLDNDLLEWRKRDRWTALFVTHSVREAVFLSSRIYLLANTPARIAECVAVDLPYPRRAELRECQEYQHIVAKVTQLLRESADE